MLLIRDRRWTLGALASAAVLAGVAFVLAGPLDPPAGVVRPSYKTLTEVEPRIAINSTNTPGDADSVYTITQPGSYYLTGNITGVAGKYGIEIASSDVAIDLNGFALLGVAGALDGITNTLANSGGIAVMNGAIRGWPQDGIDVTAGVVYGGSIDGIVAENNTGIGIRVGNQFSVTRCSSVNNTGGGLATASTCTISNCAARGNGGYGFSFTSACALSDCAAYLNTGDGYSSIFDGNTLHNCAANNNTGDGFDIDYTATIVNCAAYYNDGDGFRVSSRNVLIGNAASYNGRGASGGAGINLIGQDNRVEGNNCTLATYGIRAITSGNFITRNVCSGNTTNWDIAAGNTCLVVSGATNASAWSGNAGGTAPGSTDPNANFTY